MQYLFQEYIMKTNMAPSICRIAISIATWQIAPSITLSNIIGNFQYLAVPPPFNLENVFNSHGSPGDFVEKTVKTYFTFHL